MWRRCCMKMHRAAPLKKKKRVVKIQPFTDLLSRPAIHPMAELEKGAELA